MLKLDTNRHVVEHMSIWSSRLVANVTHVLQDGTEGENAGTERRPFSIQVFQKNFAKTPAADHFTIGPDLRSWSPMFNQLGWVGAAKTKSNSMVFSLLCADADRARWKLNYSKSKRPSVEWQLANKKPAMQSVVIQAASTQSSSFTYLLRTIIIIIIISRLDP